MDKYEKQIAYFLLGLDEIDSVLNSDMRDSDKVKVIKGFMNRIKNQLPTDDELYR